MKNLFPVLGDRKYANKVKSIMGKPVLSHVDPKDFKLVAKVNSSTI